MNKERLVKDLKLIEDMTCGCYHGTNCWLHVAIIRERAERGFYHMED